MIPFVEDAKNCLVFEPHHAEQSDSFMASLAHALKRGLLARYGLEDGELTVEPLPMCGIVVCFCSIEATEGGAGALKHLAETPNALAEVARHSLEICHFDANNGDDLGLPTETSEGCEIACYNCLLSYTNQPEHLLLDRFAVRNYLLALSQTSVREVRPHSPVVADLNGVPESEQSGSTKERIGGNAKCARSAVARLRIGVRARLAAHSGPTRSSLAR